MGPASGGSDDPFSTAVAILVCLIFSFLFAGSETAITAMGEHRVRRLLDEGKGPKRLLQLWLDDPSSLLTTLLAGNTLVNIIASAMTTSLFLQLGAMDGLPTVLAENTVSFGIFFLTLIILIFGEIAPKTLAKANPEWFLRPFAAVWIFHVTTSWFTRGIARLAKQIVGFLGVDVSRGSVLVTEEQIEDMVRLADQEGSIDESRGSLLQNVFDLDDTSVRSIMTPRTEMVALPIDSTLDETLERIRDCGFSRFLVYEGTKDQVAGVFHAKQLFNFVGRDAVTFNLRDHLAEPVFVPETQKASRLLADFQARAQHMAIVVDEHGGTSGVVTLEDVLEELVGEIYDEDDEVHTPIEVVDTGRWILNASAELRQLEEAADLELPESESYSTVGGFVTEQLGHVPLAGDRFIHKQLQFNVLEADDKRAQRVEVTLLGDDEMSTLDEAM